MIYWGLIWYGGYPLVSVGRTTSMHLLLQIMYIIQLDLLIVLIIVAINQSTVRFMLPNNVFFISYRLVHFIKWVLMRIQSYAECKYKSSNFGTSQ